MAGLDPAIYPGKSVRRPMRPDRSGVDGRVKPGHDRLFLVHPEELRNSKRVAVFRDFLLARLAEMH